MLFDKRSRTDHPLRNERAIIIYEKKSVNTDGAAGSFVWLSTPRGNLSLTPRVLQFTRKRNTRFKDSLPAVESFCDVSTSKFHTGNNCPYNTCCTRLTVTERNMCALVDSCEKDVTLAFIRDVEFFYFNECLLI